MGHLTHSLHSRVARAQRGATPPPPDKKRDWSYSQWQRSLNPEAQQCIRTKKKGKEKGEKKKRKESSYPAEVEGGVFSGSLESVRRCSAASISIPADNWTISLPWGATNNGLPPPNSLDWKLMTRMRGSSCRNQILKNKGKKFDKVFYAWYAPR